MQVSFSILRANGDVGKVYTAEGDVVSFGRSDECAVQLDNGYVSSHHAEIQCIDGRFYLQDLKSTNGTWLNESRVDGRTLVAENTDIEFGKGGPKVRVVSMLGHTEVSGNIPALEMFVAGGMPSSILSSSASAERSRSTSSNAIPQLVSIIAGGVIAFVVGVFVFKQYPQPGQETKSTQQPTSVVTTSSGNPSDGNADPKALLVDPQQQPVLTDPADIAKSVRNQCVWIGRKSTVEGETEIRPFCAGWSPTGSYVVTTGTAVQIIQQRKWSVVVFSHLLGNSDVGGFEDVDHFWVHPEFSDAGTEYDIGVIRLPTPLPLPATEVHRIASREEWLEAFNSKSIEKLLRCGYLIAAESKPVSSVAMPEYSWSTVDKLDSQSSKSLSIHPLIKIDIPATLPKLHGHIMVSSSGSFLGTLRYISPETTLMVPVDRLAQFVP